LDTKNNRIPLDVACPKHISVVSPANLPYVAAIQFATKKKLENLTHMHCF
jgi:hypothetical protein